MVPASLNDRYVIRFCVCAQHAAVADIEYAWEVISQFATDMTEYLEADNKNRIVEVINEVETNNSSDDDDDDNGVAAISSKDVGEVRKEESETCAAKSSLSWESSYPKHPLCDCIPRYPDNSDNNYDQQLKEELTNGFCSIFQTQLMRPELGSDLEEDPNPSF